MRASIRLAVAFLVAAWLSAAPARATRPLRTFPVSTLRGYAPLLTRGEMALVETDDAGRETQITLLTYVAAPPSTVRDVVMHPERLPAFVRNLSRSEVVHEPSGTLRNRWRVELPIGHFDGDYRMTDEPVTASATATATAADGASPGMAGAVGDVSVVALGDGKEGAFRWQFVPAPGGGTVLVDYGYYDPYNDNAIIARMLRKNPAYESALGLAAGLVLLKGIKSESERLCAAAPADAAHPRPTPPTGKGPGFGALLDRGSLAIIRSDERGALLDVSVVERVNAPAEQLLQILRAPSTWPSFSPSVKRCDEIERDDQSVLYRIAVSGVIADVEAVYRMRFFPGGVDAIGVEGDLRGARYRWDLTPSPSAPGTTTVVYRGNAHIGDSSSILRALFRHEPSFEHSANVGVGLVTMRTMVGRVLAAKPDPAAQKPR